MTNLAIYFECATADLSIVMSALAPALGNTRELRIETLTEAQPPTKRVLNRKRASAGGIAEVMLAAMPLDEAMPYAAIEAALEAAGYKARIAVAGDVRPRPQRADRTPRQEHRQARPLEGNPLMRLFLLAALGAGLAALTSYLIQQPGWLNMLGNGMLGWFAGSFVARLFTR